MRGVCSFLTPGLESSHRVGKLKQVLWWIEFQSFPSPGQRVASLQKAFFIITGEIMIWKRHHYVVSLIDASVSLYKQYVFMSS